MRLQSSESWRMLAMALCSLTIFHPFYFIGTRLLRWVESTGLQISPGAASRRVVALSREHDFFFEPQAAQGGRGRPAGDRPTTPGDMREFKQYVRGLL
jgi:hypothetical protein